MSLEEILQKFYDQEINIRISSFWHGGWYVSMGDEINGYKWTENFNDLPQLASYLVEYYYEQKFEDRK